MKSRATQDQRIAAVREHEAGMRADEVCSKHEISIATFYRWKAQFAKKQDARFRHIQKLLSENRNLRTALAKSVSSKCVFHNEEIQVEQKCCLFNSNRRREPSL